MCGESLSPKEMVLIEILDEKVQSQRSIAHASGFSLGMTNLLLRRLIKKGYIKIISLNGRTLRYILTPQGFAEKLRRSYDFVVASIRHLDNLKQRIQRIILERDMESKRVIIAGRNELAGLALEALRDVGIHAETLGPEEILALCSSAVHDAIVLQCDMNVDFGKSNPEEQNFELIELSGLINPTNA